MAILWYFGGLFPGVTSQVCTGNYSFQGHRILFTLLEELLRETSSMDQFVFMGMSAGAFGVSSNCDAVSQAVKLAKGKEVDVRCVMDGLDFYPTWLTVDGCDPFEVGSSFSSSYTSSPFSSASSLFSPPSPPSPPPPSPPWASL